MDYTSKKVLIMGLGRFGGGVGVARFLAGRGAMVTVTDLLPETELTRSMEELCHLPIRYRLGGHDVADFVSPDLIVINPAVDTRHNPYLEAARAAGVATTSEIRLLIEHLPPGVRTIGITGTAGKSTTTAMIGHVLQKCLNQRTGLRSVAGPWTAKAHDSAGRVHVGGNLGGSLLPLVDQMGTDDWVVLELSSFMLEDMRVARMHGAWKPWSPHIAVVTNLRPNHLDRHGNFENYALAKQEILEHQHGDDVAVLGPSLPPMIQPRHHRILRAAADGQIDGRIPLLLPGQHNQLNAWMTIEACLAAGISPRLSTTALADFPGLPHRLQFVAEADGVRFYNDSKATTPEAAMLALESFAPGTVHAILGGYDKQCDLTPLARLAGERCAAIYTIGDTGRTVADLALASCPDAKVYECGTLDTAVLKIVTQMEPGEVVLLSPGCASWDQFPNYEARGAAFVAAVLKYTGAG